MAEIVNHQEVFEKQPVAVLDQRSEQAGNLAVSAWKERESMSKPKISSDHDQVKCLSFKDDVFQSKCGFPIIVDEAASSNKSASKNDEAKKGAESSIQGCEKAKGPEQKNPEDGGKKNPHDGGPKSKFPEEGPINKEPLGKVGKDSEIRFKPGSILHELKSN